MAGTSGIRELKQMARSTIKSALKGLSPEVMQTESLRITSQVVAAPYFQQASTLGIYVHCAKLREVDTSPLLEAALQAGKRCFVPVVQDKASNMKLMHLDSMSALQPVPPYGILEPSDTYSDGRPREDAMSGSTSLQLLIMPGLGFDKQGRRLGRGGGYYDKTLHLLRTHSEQHGSNPPPLLVALAFNAQVIDSVPVNESDEPVDLLVTPDRTFACSQRGARALAQGS